MFKLKCLNIIGGLQYSSLFSDNLLTELSTRFTQMGREAVQGVLLPKNINRISEDKISQLKVFFHENVPEPDSFTQEVRMWTRKWEAVTESNDLQTYIQC